MADSPPTTNVTSRMSIDSTSVFDPFKSQSSFDSPQGATKTPSLSTNPSATNPSIANLPVAAQPGKPLSSGAKAGIAIGVLILVLSCVLVGYIWHRRRRTPQRESRREEDIQQKQPLEIHGAPISEPEIPWYDQPKDDEAMIRLFREVDGRLTDHVLNFYVLSDVEMYDEDVSTPPREIRRDLESKVSRLGQLLPLQASRAFVLRAIISERIMRSACGQAQVPVARAPKRSGMYIYPGIFRVLTKHEIKFHRFLDGVSRLLLVLHATRDYSTITTFENVGYLGSPKPHVTR